MFKRISRSLKRIAPNRKIIILVTASFLVLFVIVMLNIYGELNGEIGIDSKIFLRNSIASYKHSVEADTLKLSATLKSLAINNEIRDVYMEGDREKLYDLTLPLFKELKEDHGITHWYFINPEPDSTCFLRVHNFEIFGDRINRATYKNAVDNKDIESGIELGKTAFALRVVLPYYSRDGDLIGYMEMGEEIDHFFDIMEKETGSGINLIVAKEYLNREDWKSTIEVKGQRDNWNDMEELIHVRQGNIDCSDEDIYLADLPEEGSFRGTFKFEDSRYSRSIFPIYDAVDNKVGVVIVLTDVSAEYAEFYQEISVTAATYLVIFSIIGTIMYFSFTRMNRRMVEAKKEAEEKHNQLRTIIDTVPDPIFLKDNKHRFILNNRAHLDLIGKSDFSEVAGKTDFDVFPEDVADKAYRDEQEVIKKGKTLFQKDEIVFDKTKNKTVHLITTKVPLIDPRGKVTGLVGIVSDITKLKEASGRLALSNKELAAAKREAERSTQKAKAANQTKSNFLSSMSHEIRTPMNAILGFSELLKNMIEDPKQKQYLSSILSSGKTLLALINDILDLSKIEAGKIELQYSAVNPKNLFNEMSGIFSAKIKEKGLEFFTEIDEDLPKALQLDEVRTRQVLFNVVGNAVKFTSSGYIKLKVKGIYHKDRSRIDLKFLVKDTGIGISAEDKKIIFGAFQQSRDQSIKKYGGTGLGLSITQRLVGLMGGKISVESTVGKGTTFCIILKDIAVASVEDLAGEKEGRFADNIRFKGQEVLVVDDIESNRFLIKETLNPYNLKIIMAENGKQAIEAVKTHHPGLILMDLHMPVMDGYEAIKILKKDKGTSPIPIVALTASAMKEEEEEVKRSKADGYVRKPIKKDKLLKELTRHLAFTKEKDKPEVSMDKTVGKKSAPEEITPEVRKKLPGLISILEGRMKGKWERAEKTFIISDIKDFAAEAGELGKKYGLKILTSWADEISSQADSFDMEKLPGSFKYYPELIEEVKKLVK